MREKLRVKHNRPSGKVLRSAADDRYEFELSEGYYLHPIDSMQLKDSLRRLLAGNATELDRWSLEDFANTLEDCEPKCSRRKS